VLNRSPEFPRVPSPAVWRRGSFELLSCWLVPLVVAVAVEGKNEAFVPALYEVWYIFFVFAALAEFGC